MTKNQTSRNLPIKIGPKHKGKPLNYIQAVYSWTSGTLCDIYTNKDLANMCIAISGIQLILFIFVGELNRSFCHQRSILSNRMVLLLFHFLDLWEIVHLQNLQQSEPHIWYSRLQVMYQCNISMTPVEFTCNE